MRITYTVEDLLAFVRERVSVRLAPRHEDGNRLHALARLNDSTHCFLDESAFEDFVMTEWHSATNQIIPRAQIGRVVRLLSAEARRGAK